MTKVKETVTVGRRELSLSNLDKMFWSDEGVTKGDLIRYFEEIAPVMVRYLKDRLLTIERYPDGVDGGRFYQKSASKYFPNWIKRKTAPKEGGGSVDHVVCNEPATLVYLANQAAVTFHTSLHRVDNYDRPDQLIMDLDPSTDDFAVVRDAALATKELAEEVGLTPFVKTSGSRGLHVVVPLRRTTSFRGVRSFARSFAAELERRNPEELTTEHRKANRGDRLFLDVMRNGFGAHAVAPYSVRARPAAPVAMPIPWSEVEDRSLRADRYTIRDAVAVVEERGDRWEEMTASPASVGAAAKKLARVAR